MSTHNICFRWEIRKISCGYPLLSVAMAVGDCVRVFFDGLSGVGGGVVGRMMVGAGSMIVVFCVRSCVMVDLVVSGRVCDGGGGVSFSTQGVCRRAGVDLVVVVGRRAGAGWRGHSPAGSVGLASYFRPLQAEELINLFPWCITEWAFVWTTFVFFTTFAPMLNVWSQ